MSMNKRLNLIVSTSGIRLDKYVAEECEELSRSHVQRLIADGCITVNGKAAKEGLKLKTGDEVSVEIPEAKKTMLLPEDIPIDVIFEDGDILVVDKPAGLTVHPAPGQPEHTLVNAILNHCPDIAIGGSLRPGIVHRLDKDTSGLMVVAKNDAAHRELSNQMRSRKVVKRYTVLVHGHLTPEEGVIEAPIGRDPADRKKMAVLADGRASHTRYKMLKYTGEYTLLEVTLETGRTHQIRVHLSAIGFPVVGDRVYGSGPSIAERQFVHACYLGFKSPSNGQDVEFKSELPEDLKKVLEEID
jgi:23S rRNA pseudouridine1911/1915/1917 synthase